MSQGEKPRQIHRVDHWITTFPVFLDHSNAVGDRDAWRKRGLFELFNPMFEFRSPGRYPQGPET
jgi:hypothetical protein